MAGLNLNALGAGLGLWAQQYRQQQEAAQRAQLQRLYMQKQADEQAALGIQAQTLAAGSPGLGGLSGLPGGFQPVGGSPQQPPAVATPATQAQPRPSPPAVGQGPLISSEPPIEREDTMPNTGMSVTGPPGHGIGTGIPEVPSGREDTIEGRQTYAPPPEPEVPGTPAAQPAGAETPPAGEQANMQPVLQAPSGQQIDLAQFMHRTDPVELMQRIKRAAPNATPQQQMLALNGLYKIYQSDNKTEQMLLAKVLGFNVGMARIQTTQRGQDITHGDRVAGQTISKQRADTAERQGDQRIALSNTRIQQNQQRINQALGIADKAQRSAALRAELRSIQQQLTPGGLNQPPDDATKAALQKQLRDVTNELRKISGMPELAPQPSTPLPGGGATAPLP